MDNFQASKLRDSFRDILGIDIDDSQLMLICDAVDEEYPPYVNEMANEAERERFMRHQIEYAIYSAREQDITVEEWFDKLIDDFQDDFGYESENFPEIRDYYLSNKEYFDSM